MWWWRRSRALRCNEIGATRHSDERLWDGIMIWSLTEVCSPPGLIPSWPSSTSIMSQTAITWDSLDVNTPSSRNHHYVKLPRWCLRAVASFVVILHRSLLSTFPFHTTVTKPVPEWMNFSLNPPFSCIHLANVDWDARVLSSARRQSLPELLLLFYLQRMCLSIPAPWLERGSIHE